MTEPLPHNHSSEVVAAQLHPTAVYDGRDFAIALAQLRASAGFSIRDLAKATGIPSATLGGYFSGRHLPSRSADSLIPILRLCGVANADVPDWLAAWSRARRTPGPRPAAAAQPYRGLTYFDASDAEWFFGRERIIATITEKLAATDGGGSSMFVLTGPSGSGKSSVLRAGLAARFGGDGLVMTPGPAPMAELCDRLGQRSKRTPTDVAAALAELGPLPSWLVEALPALIVLDQAEELFTPAVSDCDREELISALHRLTAHRARRTAVVLGLRSDFYQQASEQPGLVGTLQDRQILLGAMSEAELRRAIVEPARRAGISVDDELVELILRDMAATSGRRGAHSSGSLPLMSHALMEAWQFARRGRLTCADYLQTGGIERAAQQTAEDLFAALSSSEQALARRIFLRLVHVDDAQPLTRRRVSSAELLQLTPQQSEAGRVLERFVASRLLTLEATSVELSHESLLLAWPRLAGWVEQDLASLRRLRQLTAQAQQWEEAGRTDDELLRGLKLEESERWLDTDPRWQQELNRTEREFLAASSLAERCRLTMARRGVRRTRRLLSAVTVLLVLSCSFASYAFHARSASNAAEREAQYQRDLAQSGQVAVEADRVAATNPALANQLALAAYRISPTAHARSALLDSVARPSPSRVLGQPGPTAIARSTDGGLVAMSNAIAGSVQLLRPEPGARTLRRVGSIPGPGKHNQLFALAFMPDSAVIATGGEDSLVRLWDVSDPAQPRLLGQPLPGIKQAVQVVAFSPDSRLMAAGGGGSTVWLWDVSRPAAPRLLPSITGLPSVVQGLAFAPDGRTLVLGGQDGLLQRWNVADHRRPTRLPSLAAPPSATTVASIAYSPDGSLLAVGCKNGSLYLWQHASAARPLPVATSIPPVTGWINVVAFAPNGQTLAVASSNNLLTTWSVPSWRRDKVLPHPGPVTGVSFTADGAALLSASADGAGRLWQLPGSHLPGTASNVFAVSYSKAGALAVGTSTADAAVRLWQPGERRTVQSAPMPSGLKPDGTAAISPDGRLVAAGSEAGPLALWAVSAGRLHLIGVLRGPADLVEHLTFSPDSRLLAVASDDAKVHLWDVSNAQRPRALPAVTGPKKNVLYVAFTPDSRTLAAASADNTIRLWDISDPGAARPLSRMEAFDSYAMTVTFSPDGKVMAAGSADHLIRIWNVSDRTRPVQLGSPLTGPDDRVYSVAISPDSRLLAAGSTDHTVRVWDISNPTNPVATVNLRATGVPIYTVAFSPDGSTLAASGIGGDVYLWPTSAEAAIARICSHGGDQVTETEWRTYINARAYSPPCASS
jgi:WD40 repeat protein/transcriptional regulator with XRE-family HTH domain